MSTKIDDARNMKHYYHFNWFLTDLLQNLYGFAKSDVEKLISQMPMRYYKRSESI